MSTDVNPLPDGETLRRMIEAEQQSRVQACQQALQAVLVEHRCELFAQPQVTSDGRIVAVVGLRAT